jgi:hypothetical protein
MRSDFTIAEIRCDVLFPVEAHTVDQLEAHVLGQQVAHRIEVVRIEALDVGFSVASVRARPGPA